jgi:hypothetical protein
VRLKLELVLKKRESEFTDHCKKLLTFEAELVPPHLYK